MSAVHSTLSRNDDPRVCHAGRCTVLASPPDPENDQVAEVSLEMFLIAKPEAVSQVPRSPPESR